ncbi:SMI1/KNR4 family protein [Calidithermus terrae]|uniref:SMI1/KNR4 family protein n=1 Tax=Calidithermus terrae TaxID=1408545 RepID=UPI00146FA7A3|nr:SMI1/KNR4 family protein [Calidithermus terrae]
MTEIDQAVKRLVESGLAPRDFMCGCSEEEVNELEEFFGIQLPEAYRYFLERLGKSAGTFLIGTDFLFATLKQLRSEAEDLLETDNAPFRLSSRHFVFAVHQGYQFLFFDALAGDDPPVLHYLEGESEPKEVFPCFSRWLSNAVDDEIKAQEALEKGE